MALSQQEIIEALKDPNNALSSASFTPDGTIKLGSKNQTGQSHPTDKTATGDQVMKAFSDSALSKGVGENIYDGSISKSVSDQTQVNQPGLLGKLAGVFGWEPEVLNDPEKRTGLSRMLATVGEALSPEGGPVQKIAGALKAGAAGRQQQSLMQGRELGGISGFGVSPGEYAEVLRQQMAQKEMGIKQQAADTDTAAVGVSESTRLTRSEQMNESALDRAMQEKLAGIRSRTEGSARPVEVGGRIKVIDQNGMIIGDLGPKTAMTVTGTKETDAAVQDYIKVIDDTIGKEGFLGLAGGREVEDIVSMANSGDLLDKIEKKLAKGDINQQQADAAADAAMNVIRLYQTRSIQTGTK